MAQPPIQCARRVKLMILLVLNIYTSLISMSYGDCVMPPYCNRNLLLLNGQVIRITVLIVRKKLLQFYKNVFIAEDFVNQDTLFHCVKSDNQY